VKRPRHGGEIFAASRRQGVSVSSVLDFSANINPLGPSPKAVRRLRRELNLIRFYPDSKNEEVRRLVADREAVDPRSILFGNGASQLLHAIPRLLKPASALIVEPGFAEYQAALQAVGCKIHRLYLKSETGFRLERTALFRAVGQKRPKLIILGNPNNPTGGTIPDSLLLELLDCCAKKCIHLVLDESFVDFSSCRSLLPEASRQPYLVVVRSLTKFWALPGLRIGFLGAQEAFVKKLSAHMEPWSVNTLAWTAAAASLGDSEYRRKTVTLVRKERAFLSEQLSQLRWLKPYPSDANFLLVRIAAKGLSSSNLQARLESRNILIRDASNFPGLGRQHIRIAVRNRSENQRLIAELRSIGRSLGYRETKAL
jgi:threonine-phosphate decarboxylase